MITYSEKDYRRMHINLWDYMIKNPKLTKPSYPYWRMYGKPKSSTFCFACEYAFSIDPDNYCDYCPVIWRSVVNNRLYKNSCAHPGCQNKWSAFNVWMDSAVHDKPTYAKIIRDSWRPIL